MTVKLSVDADLVQKALVAELLSWAGLPLVLLSLLAQFCFCPVVAHSSSLLEEIPRSMNVKLVAIAVLFS